ncbi:hypothetical protein [Corynebacterium sp. CCM 9203]|uniref:hypothetical protein n=1 Tax=Corynebacterium sp. CCM 9203 TaxID=3057615 RepID=UPI003525A539
MFFAASLRPPLGYGIGAVIIGASTLLNNSIPVGIYFYLAIAHGEIITVPFLVFLAYATSTARRLDARVASLRRAHWSTPNLVPSWKQRPDSWRMCTTMS